MPRYTDTSPYSRTRIIDDKYADDVLYTIEPQYSRRPDLLAFDLYQSPKLWWVFAQRNPDVLQDPVFDFTPGTEIYLPKGNALKDTLGV